MSLLDYRPCLSDDDALRCAGELFGLDVENVKSLPSERDQNFLLLAGDQQRFVLKVSNAAEPREFLDAQNQIFRHLSQRVPVCPRPQFSNNGNGIETFRQGNHDHMVRLVTFLDGLPMSTFCHHSPELLTDLGRSVGNLDVALSEFDHPALHRKFHWDLAQSISVIDERIGLVDDPQIRRLIEYFVQQYKRFAVPLLDQLPQSVIHNDANDANVIVRAPDSEHFMPSSVAGIIDFGDAVYSWTVADLAIATAYAILKKDDPLAAAVQIIRGYHAQRSLIQAEVDALFGLICMRLCTSAVIAAQQMRSRPDDPYLVVSQEPIRDTLPRLKDISFPFASAVFREAVGMPVVPAGNRISQWLKQNRNSFRFPVNPTHAAKRPAQREVLVLDLGVESLSLTGDPTRIDEPWLTQHVFSNLRAVEASIGVGRYLEPRFLYSSAQFSGGQNWWDERRTIHLGIDLFAPAGTPVLAPLDGQVSCAQVIERELDYGGMLILQHETPDGDVFFTLYGHLAPDSISALRTGQQMKQGQPIAALGQPHENGGWTPHCHFQLILDLLDFQHLFPGVGQASRQAVWSKLSPDPNLVLNIPEQCFPQPSPTRTQTLRRRRKRIGSSLSLAYQEPLKIVRGWKNHVWDETARCYIDAYNNVPHVGHCNSQVVEKTNRQMSLLNTNTRYLHDNINRLADRLSETMPEGLDVCFFLSSASEANELALRLARTVTGKRNLIVLGGAYHGHTTTLIDISPYKHEGPGGAGRPDWVHVAPLADIYRGEFNDPSAAGHLFAAKVKRITQRLQGELCGFIAESCPSVGGQIIFPAGYLSEVYRLVRDAGGLCIADDVQTAYGRLGEYFYGFQQQQVVPDIVVLGKPIANGHPLAAVVTTRKIADAFDNGMEFFATFGGNPVSCAAGLAVLDALCDGQLQKNAVRVGRQLLNGFAELQQKHPLIGDVRGSGFFLGVELVRNHQTLEPAAAEAEFVVNRMRQLGVLIGTDGPWHNVLKIRPPMTFQSSDADVLLAALDRALLQCASLQPQRISAAADSPGTGPAR